MMTENKRLTLFSRILMIKRDNNNIVVAAFVIILFMRSYILRESTTLSSASIKMIINAATWGCILVALFFQLRIQSVAVNKYLIGQIACVLFYFVYQVITSYTYVGLDITNAVVCVLILLQPEKIKSDVYVVFKKIMVVEAFVGIIIFLVHIMPFICLPHSVVSRQIGSGTSYANYIISYILLDVNGQIRLCGLFDEPGYFATFIALFLCADNLNLKKKENIILFVAGVLSFSMGFYFLLAVCYVMKNIRNIKKWILLLCVGLLALLVLPNIRTGNEHIDHNIIRLSNILSSKNFLSMNGSRYDARFSDVVNSLTEKTKLFLVGYGAGYVNYFKLQNNTAAETFLRYLVDFGVVGTVLIFLPLLFLTIRYNRKDYGAIVYIIVVFVNLFQRPYFYVASYFMMFACGLAYIGCSENRERIQDI